MKLDLDWLPDDLNELPLGSIVVATQPGMEHAFARDGEALRQFLEWAHSAGGAVEGLSALWVLADATRALNWALTLANQGAGVALAHGPLLVGPPPWSVWGKPAELCRKAHSFARAREVLALPSALAACTVPEGVGQFPAPAALSTAVGQKLTVLKDYR